MRPQRANHCFELQRARDRCSFQTVWWPTEKAASRRKTSDPVYDEFPMAATWINGTKIAEDIKREISAEVETLKGRGIRPGLAVVLVGEDAASSAYVNMKAKTCEQLGIYSRKLTIPSAITTEQLLAEVRKLNEDDSIDGILVQLPLPKHVHKHSILEG